MIRKKIIFLFLGLFICLPGAKEMGLSANEPGNLTNEPAVIKMTVLYDNYLFSEGTKPEWGFSCLIEGTEKTILFDTGTRPDTLMHNAKQLKVDLKKVEQVVISHHHGDHTGGLFTMLDRKPGISVYLPHSFPDDFVGKVENAKAKAVRVKEPVEICKNVFLTGEMGDQIKEQSLILNTAKGLVIVTGCSHQGIVNIVKRAKKMLNKNVYLVFGGFHLVRHSQEEVKNIIRGFKELGVVKCGATHCTGDKPIQMFKEAYGDNYVKIGTGRFLEVPIK
jgi:7,8-dihydropterin-6-yl-methyl-4-(beta-D-ribofuranosyl)aminobenzene 5'-phosphate synthase